MEYTSSEGSVFSVSRSSLRIPETADLLVAIDSTGNCYIAGVGDSNGPAATPGAFQSHTTSLQFVMKLAPNGQVVFATYLGGSGQDVPVGLVVDSQGNTLIIGNTTSNDFPTSHPTQSSFGGGTSDAFVAKISSDGSALVYSTYLGGSGTEKAFGIAVDSSGNAFVTGATNSSDFKTTSVSTGTNFIGRLDPNGAITLSLLESFLQNAGSPIDAVGGIGVDGAGNIYLAGNGPEIAKVDAQGSLVYRSSRPISTVHFVHALTVDSNGNAYVAEEYSANSVAIAAFAANATSPTLIVLGADSLAKAGGVAMDSSGEVFISGYTVVSSSFPIYKANDGTASNLQIIPGGVPGSGNPLLHDFLTKFSPIPATVLALPSGLVFQPQQVGTSSSSTPMLIGNYGNSNININGISISGDFTESNNCPATLVPQGVCLVNVTFSPTVSGSRTGSILVSDDAPGTPHTVRLSGTTVSPQISFSSSSLTFPVVSVGQTSAAQTVTLSVVGPLPVQISRIDTTGDFAETNNCGVTLQSSCQIAVTFTPTSAGTRTGMLVITDDAQGSPQTIALSGSGLAGLGLAVANSSSSTATVSAGGTALYNIVIGGVGITGTATLMCTGAPSGAQCIAPASVALSDTVATTFSVQVSTRGTTVSGLLYSQPYWVGFAFALLMCVTHGGRKRQRNMLALVSVCSFLLNACGGHDNSTPVAVGTPSGTYTLTLTATSGSASQSIPLTLIVK